jgi:hypothetical protein
VVGLEGTARNAALVPQIQQIGADLLLGEQIRKAHVMPGEPTDRAQVDFQRPLRKARQRHVFDHTLTLRRHGRSPFEPRSRDQLARHSCLVMGPSRDCGGVFRRAATLTC